MITPTITDADRALLRRPLHGYLTVAPKADGFPAPRPVWFEYTDDGVVQVFSTPGSPKLDRLAEDPRASLVVAAPQGEPESWVSVVGSVTTHRDGARELARRLAEQYWEGELDTQAPRELLDDWRTADLVRIVIHPRRVTRYA